MRKSTLIANRDNRRLDDAELAGITGGKLLVSDIDCLEQEINRWTELIPTEERIPLVPLEPARQK
ncbi:hypothetical protein [Noviherbaspirillum pedocola]|uniref:Uncharacterized protein n=1 Tax=Noviherbaspirillum pedocola TaxID=2801341 RepID=A0A934T442_9BURK|nr:hypothetical protein [Noviherbaspirillum pedocola]MBK4738548.1 hypothetical protein [Noviherbaspirillum pedocola]